MSVPKLFLAVIIFLSLLFCAQETVSAQSMRVMTFNIRYDSPNDGPNVWMKRRENLVSMIRFHKADLVGLQEAQIHQIEFIIASLPEYGWFGGGRDDGRTKGEFAAILYRKDRFDTVITATFWCSQTPDKPGLGWDAAYPRVTSYGKLKDKLNGKQFFFFNTHLDNEGAVARLESAKLIKQTMQKVCRDFPVILSGDFNTAPGTDPYKTIVAAEGPYAAPRMFDTRVVSKTKPHGPTGTFTGFELTAKPLEAIDFIFATKHLGVSHHGTLSDSFDGLLPSDHYPVIAELVW